MHPHSETYADSDLSQVQRIGDQTVALYRQDPAHAMPRFRISDAAHGEAVAGLVIVCTDVVLVNREAESFYLTTRRTLPMRGLWWMGGRMLAGETERESIVRVFASETRLDLPSDRFVETPRLSRYQWSERQQEPQDHGSDNLCYNYSLEPTDSELTSIKHNLDPHEYEQATGLRQLNRAQLQGLLEQGLLHPVIWDIYCTIFSQ